MNIQHKTQESGQSAPEYALILAGLAVIVLVALGLIGIRLSNLFTLTASTSSEVAAISSPLGTTFTDISDNMINLIMDFYRQHNYWPRSWGDYAYSDLGLKPEDWAKSYEGIIYKPIGNRVAITPAEGYTFEVTDISGTVIRLPSSYHWSLVYDMQTGTWHHKNINGPTLQIKTLKVIPPQPKPS